MKALRDYQLDMLARLDVAWVNHRSVMVQMPTGTGKTHVLAAVVHRYVAHKAATDGGVWIVAHRRELVAQIEGMLVRYGMRPSEGTLQVMSIQWLARHAKDGMPAPALIVIDEAHHALASTYAGLWRLYPEARKLGMTATPCRMDGEGFTDLFDVLLPAWDIAGFIRRGWLAPFDYVTIRPDSGEQRLIDGLRKRGADGDYQVKEMEAVLNRRPGIERLYSSVEQYAAGRKGIVYAVSIAHARSIAAYYAGRGMVAAAIDSRTPLAERGRLVEDFRVGRLRVLVNVDVFSEGFDCPDVEFVQMARPTLSLAKYLQQVGRGLRRTEGKRACILIDNVGLYHRFGLPSALRDWEAMFRGWKSGRVGVRDVLRPEPATLAVAVDDLAGGGTDVGMEVVMTHERLCVLLAEDAGDVWRGTPAPDDELRCWRDRKTGRWGLKVGETRVTDAVYAEVFGTKYGWAAVRYPDGTCGLVDRQGADRRHGGRYRDMRFLAGRLLAFTASGGDEHYVDLMGLHVYDSRPRVERYSGVDLLRVGRTYYSRTRERYTNPYGLTPSRLLRRGFYLAIPDGGDTVCLMAGDAERYYRLVRRLPDGTVVVKDGSGRCYRASADGGVVGIDDVGEKSDAAHHSQMKSRAYLI